MDEVNMFRIKGSFKQSKHRQPFTKEIVALNEKQAVENLYSDLGSRHRVKRGAITIDEVAKAEPEAPKEVVEEEKSE